MTKRSVIASAAVVTAAMMDTPLGQDLGPGQNPTGLICAANESRFTSGHYSEQLTGYTVGWRDPEDIDSVLQRLFPEVMVARRFDFKKANNAEAFLSETDDLRPIGSPFKRVEYTGTSASSKTHNRGLTIRIDHDECDDLESEVTRSVDRLMQRCRRNSLRRGLALLDANDTAIGAKAWNKDTNPDGDLRAMGRASADACGIFPNVFAIGEAAWHLRLDAYEASARLNQNRASWTAQQLAQYLLADTVEIVKARYQSAAAAKAVVLASRVYAYLAIQGAGKDDPSAVKRFVSASRGGQRFGVYRQDEEKWTDVSVEYYENNTATGIGIQSIDPASA